MLNKTGVNWFKSNGGDSMTNVIAGATTNNTLETKMSASYGNQFYTQ